MGIEKRKITSYKKSIKSLSDTPNQDGMTADDLKAFFDGRTDEEVKESINGIIDDLRSESGAQDIGNAPLKPGGSLTVAGQISELNDEVNKTYHSHQNKAELDKIEEVTPILGNSGSKVPTEAAVTESLEEMQRQVKGYTDTELEKRISMRRATLVYGSTDTISIGDVEFDNPFKIYGFSPEVDVPDGSWIMGPQGALPIMTSEGQWENGLKKDTLYLVTAGDRKFTLINGASGGSGGGGGMQKSVYDPSNRAMDIFAYADLAGSGAAERARITAVSGDTVTLGQYPGAKPVTAGDFKRYWFSDISLYRRGGIKLKIENTVYRLGDPLGRPVEYLRGNTPHTVVLQQGEAHLVSAGSAANIAQYMFRTITLPGGTANDSVFRVQYDTPPPPPGTTAFLVADVKTKITTPQNEDSKLRFSMDDPTGTGDDLIVVYPMRKIEGVNPTIFDLDKGLHLFLLAGDGTVYVIF